jgi:hypothetical protein
LSQKSCFCPISVDKKEKKSFFDFFGGFSNGKKSKGYKVALCQPTAEQSRYDSEREREREREREKLKKREVKERVLNRKSK